MFDVNRVYEELIKEISEEQVRLKEVMSKHTSFKIGGEADIFVKAKTISEIKYVIKLVNQYQIPLTILGNGSNLLVKDEGIRGIVLNIKLEQMKIIEKGDEYLVSVGAGMKLMTLARNLLNKEITGFEFASGIPGTIGGAIRMNAGAYGGEMKDVVITTTYMDLEGDIHTIDNKDHKFEYRHSIFCDKEYIILETELKLAKGDYDTIKARMDEYQEHRKQKQPVTMPSAGSTFKRGSDFITAKLIDECGLKGYKIGGAMVSDIHAGFVVNTGDATAKDVLELVEYIKKEVYTKFQKKIELEIEVV